MEFPPRALAPRPAARLAALGPVLAALGAAFCVLTCGRGEDAGRVPPRVERPNVVLIVVDTLRKDHLGAYGYQRDTSPNIDRLAAMGVRYDAAQSQAPWTTPSIAALLTSRYPTTLGIADVRSVLDENFVLLSERLRQAGYATGAVVSHDFCSARWGFNQGFDSFEEANVFDMQSLTGGRVTERALAFLEAHASRPFFLFLHYYDPHSDYVGHPDFDPAPSGDYAGFVTRGMPLGSLDQLARRLEPADLAELVRFYDSEIGYTDHQIGRVLDRLRELSLFDDALVVLTADHGEEFKDHGRLGHTTTLYTELVNVPLIIKYPRGEAAVEQTPVALLDVYPTVLDYLALPRDPALAGRSLLAGPAARESEPRAVFTETDRVNRLRAVVRGEKKLILDLRTGETWFFDLAADPAERVNLAAAPSAALESLRRALDEWIQQVEATRHAGREIALTREEIERLEALGYVDHP